MYILTFSENYYKTIAHTFFRVHIKPYGYFREFMACNGVLTSPAKIPPPPPQPASKTGTQAFTNCMQDYDRARNMHTNGVTCTQKFVHNIDSSV